MDSSKTPVLPAGLADVRRRFERWRQAHRPRSRIPDSLWSAAASAAGKFGIHRTSRALRLDYYGLKERVEQQSSDIAAPATNSVANQHLQSLPTFFELAPPAAAGSCECTLELENAAGAKMRVQVKHVATPDLAALSRSFWNSAT